MALIKCKECGSEISSKAVACPRCGAKPRRTSGCAWLVLILLGLLIIPPMISGVVSGFNGAKNRVKARTTEAIPQMPSASPTPETSNYRQSNYDSRMIVDAKRAVKAALRDPDSAQFRDIRYGEAEETGAAVYGHVNSKNALGGYGGFVKFVSNGRTTLIEGRDTETAEVWRKLYSATLTERTLTALPQNAPASPVKIDALKLAGKTVKEVNAFLGQPSSQEKISEGNKFIYKQKEVEVVFAESKANLISIDNLESIPFTPSAITAIGLPASKPFFASDIVLKWRNIKGIAEISIFRGQKGCDYAYIIVKEPKKERKP